MKTPLQQMIERQTPMVMDAVMNRRSGEDRRARDHGILGMVLYTLGILALGFLLGRI